MNNSNIQCKSSIGVPSEKSMRDNIVYIARNYVAKHQIIPPFTIQDLKNDVDEILKKNKINTIYKNFLTVILGNEVWRDVFASVPFEKRILLLPQCLRSKKYCKAEMDEFGLLCEQCGKCPIGGLQAEAEKLGYVVLVAEGTTVVTKLLEYGTIDAVVGVSCLTVLEKAFPHVAADSVPSIAIPLIIEGCEDTIVDLDWIKESIGIHNSKKWFGRADITAIKNEVNDWFAIDSLKPVINKTNTQTEEIALSWLAIAGKRWRPLLAALVYKALTNDRTSGNSIKELAIAVECFHKASLIHDDIEDNDDYRYDTETVHRVYGIPIALNAGDFLLGEGYRLITEIDASPEAILKMISVASSGHRSLSLGQGDELSWRREFIPLTTEKVIDIFKRKTAPAFSVALNLGAIYANADKEIYSVLENFSQSMGIAYQIYDDFDDFFTESEINDADALRPSLIFAIAYEKSTGDTKEILGDIWMKGDSSKNSIENLKKITGELRVIDEVKSIYNSHKTEALNALKPIKNRSLKSILYRITHKILKDIK